MLRLAPPEATTPVGTALAILDVLTELVRTGSITNGRRTSQTTVSKCSHSNAGVLPALRETVCIEIRKLQRYGLIQGEDDVGLRNCVCATRDEEPVEIPTIFNNGIDVDSYGWCNWELSRV